MNWQALKKEQKLLPKVKLTGAADLMITVIEQMDPLRKATCDMSSKNVVLLNFSFNMFFK